MESDKNLTRKTVQLHETARKEKRKVKSEEVWKPLVIQDQAPGEHSDGM